MIDKVHERPKGTAKNTFHRNKDKLVEGEDYFKVPHEEWTQIMNGTAVRQTYRGPDDDEQETAVHNMDGAPDTGQRNPIIMLTASGYLMLVKTFNHDLVWKVQRRLAGEVLDYISAEELLGFINS